MPTPLGATHRTHKDLIVGYDHPDHHRAVGVLLGPDRDLPHLTKSNEMAHNLLARDWPNIPPERFVSIPLFSPPDPVRASGGSGHV
jgi:hypothetical protein